MKPMELVRQMRKEEIDRHKSQLEEIEKEEEFVNSLPKEIADLEDCAYVDYHGWSDELYFQFKNDDTARILKMIGVQGLVAVPAKKYGTNEVIWHWDFGKMTCNNHNYSFYVGEAKQPSSCEIVEEDEVVTTPLKRIKVICHETGKETKL